MIKYIHGSKDSIDLDIHYVFDNMPDYNECRRFCSEDNTENRNIIVIKNGIVTDCFIGTCDEINNGLIDTYNLHKQEYELLVTKRIERDVLLKFIRAIRGIISILSRTEYRKEIKFALKKGLGERIKCLKEIDFTNINFDELDKRMNKEDLLKVIAFQIGQSIGLFESVELYTKREVSEKYPELMPFLYRQDKLDYNTLNKYKDLLLKYGEIYDITDEENGISKIVEPKNIVRIFDMVHEKEVL